MSITKPQSPLKASTQDFIGIEDISEDIILLKDRSCSIIIESGSVNYDLLDTEEQKTLIFSYSSLLNSLSFPIQISIISQKKDISGYLEYIDAKIKNQQNDFLKTRLVSYKEFIAGLIDKNVIMEKRFYFIISFSPIELGIHMKDAYAASHDYVFSRAKAALYPKKDHLLRLLKKAGLGGKVLPKQEILQLFYTIYNTSYPSQHISTVTSYTDPIVKS